MVRSKALETLGILKSRENWLAAHKRHLIVLFFGLAISYGLYSAFSCISFGSAGSGKVFTSKDDGSLFLKEHLAIQEVNRIDTDTEEREGEMVTKARKYWFKVSIDENWYSKRFVPAVKKYLAEIAPDAEVCEAILDTKDLVYANDGADKLNKYGNHEDSMYITDPSITIVKTNSSKRRLKDVKNLIVVEGVNKDGSTRASLYKLRELELNKFQNWVRKNVIRDRKSVGVKVCVGNRELTNSSWDLRFWPWDDSYNAAIGWSDMISPWARCGCSIGRCHFVGVSVTDDNGVSDNVEFEWSL